MNREFIQKLTSAVKEHLSDENFGPENLAEKMGMSHSTLHRKLRDISNQTISQFIRETRLNKAKDLLLTEEITISEIAYKVGFGSPTYFNKCFHELFGVAPGEFKKQEAEKEPESEPENLLPKKKLQNVFLFVVAPILIIASVFLFLSEKNSFLKIKTPIEKSIAVLPLNYLGDPQYQHQAEGTKAEIQYNLSQIEDIRVVDISTYEKYSSMNKSEKGIGNELNVGAYLKITFQKEGENAILNVELIKANNGTVLFHEKYPVSGLGIFAMQSKIAQTIAEELKAEITLEEKQRIEKIHTLSITALDFYQRGNEQYQEYDIFRNNKNVLEKALIHYQKAIELDSTFAKAYVGLSKVYMRKHLWDEYYTDNYLDSTLLIVNQAIHFEDQLSEAHVIKGEYYRAIFDIKKADKEYKKAIKLEPNSWQAYLGRGQMYFYDDFLISIQCFEKAASLNHGKEFPMLLNALGNAYFNAGFVEKGEYYTEQVILQNFDSTLYYLYKAGIDRRAGKNEKAVDKFLKAYSLSPKNLNICAGLANLYIEMKQYNNALKYYKQFYEGVEKINANIIDSYHRIGYAYLMNGFEEEGNKYIDKHIEVCNEMNRFKRHWSQQKYTYYDLAAIYAFRGDKENAYKNLRIFNQRKTMPNWMADLIKKDPLFNGIRNEPEFQQVEKDVEAKFQTEHERVKKWLEEQGLL